MLQLDAAGCRWCVSFPASDCNRGDTVVLCSTLKRWANRRATRHCEVVVPLVPRSLPSLGHTQVVNSNSGTQELASEQRVVISCDQL